MDTMMRGLGKWVPVEVCGYRSVRRYVVDNVNGSDGFRWYSVPNDNFLDEDIEVWTGDSLAISPPF